MLFPLGCVRPRDGERKATEFPRRSLPHLALECPHPTSLAFGLSLRPIRSVPTFESSSELVECRSKFAFQANNNSNWEILFSGLFGFFSKRRPRIPADLWLGEQAASTTKFERRKSRLSKRRKAARDVDVVSLLAKPLTRSRSDFCSEALYYDTK